MSEKLKLDELATTKNNFDEIFSAYNYFCVSAKLYANENDGFL